MHNFSLIHDDIQDKSSLRRGRPTVWVKWGIAQAINAGDAMLGLSQLELLDSLENIHTGVDVQVSKLFNQTLVELTRGQYLDLTFEQREAVTMQQYEWMTAGKTGALIAACTETGALLGGADLIHCSRMREFGRLLGHAFQIQDDWMGIWGDEELTGKSVHSDLVERKKTYPVILGLDARGAFSQEWGKLETITSEEADHIASLLAYEGIKAKTESSYREEYDRALRILADVPFDDRLKGPLYQLAQSLMTRVK
jgi:geranylgeranyl diphosphate synthase type I